jgi:hypothetical protein
MQEAEKINLIKNFEKPKKSFLKARKITFLAKLDIFKKIF